MTKDYDIIIVGAGPAGSSCALMLAHKGYKIAITDKTKFPRGKICGDALSGNVMNTLKRLPSNIYSEFINKFDNKLPSYGIRFIAPNLKHLDIPFSFEKDASSSLSMTKSTSAPGYICRRIDFDNFLFQQLKNYPDISIFENCEIENIIVSDDYVKAFSKDYSFTAKIIVGADGAYSIVKKSLSTDIANLKDFQYHHKCIGLRAYYENVTGFNNDNYIELYFLKDILPGYFWLFPLPGNTANVGIGMQSEYIRKRKINLKEVMSNIIKNHPLISGRFKNAKQTEDIKGYVLPLGGTHLKRAPARISGKRYLLTGDAASLIDPFTGEGVGNAMLSGRYAAEQIIKCFESNDFSDAILKDYDNQLYSKIWQELKISRTMQGLSKYPFLFNLVVNKANKNETLRNTIIQMINNTDLKNELTKPSFYFKLLFD